MNSLNHFISIERPIPIVYKALIDSFSVFNKNAKIIKGDRQLSTQIDTNLLPTAIKSLTITVHLDGRKKVGNHTYLHSKIYYSLKESDGFKNIIKRWFLRIKIDAIISMRLNDFKQRVEKWM